MQKYFPSRQMDLVKYACCRLAGQHSLLDRRLNYFSRLIVHSRFDYLNDQYIVIQNQLMIVSIIKWYQDC